MRKTPGTFLLTVLVFFFAINSAFAVEAPRIEKKDGRYALMVEGRPYLVLGGQIHNSSAWPSELQQVWESMAALHANTIEAPAYWEQIEAQEGHFDFGNVDQLIEGARAHNLHVILLVQVENESGGIGSVRDFAAESNREFAGKVPADLLTASGKQPGTWSQVFGADADEVFQIYHQAKYVNEIAAAGKREFDIPCYMNVWLSHVTNELPQRQVFLPGIQYPSGGAVQRWVGLWRALAPAMDMIAPDIYTSDSNEYRDTIRAYARPDNPLMIPETGRSDAFAKFFFYALG